METETESIYCKDEVSGEFFDEECITQNNNFASVCLHREALKATLGGLNNLRGDRMNIENRSLLYAAYRLFTCNGKYSGGIPSPPPPHGGGGGDNKLDPSKNKEEISTI